MHLVANNGNVRSLLLELILTDQMSYLPPSPQTHLVAKNGDFRFLMLVSIGRSAILDFYCQFILVDELADQPPWERHLVAKNGNFRFLLLEFILADQLAYLSSQRHLVAKNGNFRFLLLGFILADQLADLPPIDTSSNKEW